MTIRTCIPVALIIAMALPVHAINAQRRATPRAGTSPARAIRRDIPMTNMIRRAFAAGTRDSSGRPGARYWQLGVDYTISARFDPSNSRIAGREAIAVHNNSDSALRTIQMRLDQNLFAPNVPRAEVVTDITDGMKLTKLVVAGQPVDLNAPPPPTGRGRGAAGAASAAPPVNAITGASLTSAVIHLATPIAAHGTGTIEVEWNFAVPRSDGVRGIRMGRWGDSLYQVAQWYPRVAVYDDLRGWDTDPYLGPSEFYNNLGHFDVQLDVPAGWLVGATGVLRNPDDVYTPTIRERLSHVTESDSQRSIVSAEERGPGKSTSNGDRLIWHFVADSVTDFAWATSDRFVFDATRANIPGQGEIPIYLMYEPGNAARFCTQGATGRHALEFYSKLWMPYTYPSLTQVDGPEGGMEYPMFIMAAGSTDHEIGHQWWPMMVNTNETWYGFMDEGFNNWMNTLSAADRNPRIPGQPAAGRGGAAASRAGAGTCPPPAATYGPTRTGFENATIPVPPFRFVPPPGGTATENGSGQSYGRISGDELEAPLMWDANYGGPRYSTQAYGISGPMLSMLGGIAGDSAVWHAMSDYAKAWRFKHPSPWDYAFFMSRALHRDLGWFWYYWLFTTESVDGSIGNVTRSGAQTTVIVHQDGEMPAPVVLAVQLAGKGPAIRRPADARMLDSATVLLTWPADVWLKGNRTFKAQFDLGGRKIQRITLDPFGRFPDRSVADNVWPRDSVAASPTSVTRRRP